MPEVGLSFSVAHPWRGGAHGPPSRPRRCHPADRDRRRSPQRGYTAAAGTTLVALFGIAPVLAAKILGRVGDVRRFLSAGHFASYSVLQNLGPNRRSPATLRGNSASPGHTVGFATSCYCGVAIEALSGDVVRHRLSRAGDRQLNFALHIMATCQARQHPASRTYHLRKRAEGHSEKEALRCLKRRLAAVVYRTLLRDASAVPCTGPSAASKPRQDLGYTCGLFRWQDHVAGRP
jgi:transposase